MIDSDSDYGTSVKINLAKKNFNNFVLFEDEKDCLSNMIKKPKILITGYHLKNSSGLQLIKKAKAIYPDFFSILLSGEFHNETFKVFDERFLQYVDKYIIKGMDDMEELIETVTYNFA